MNRKTLVAPIFVIILCLLSSGCISIEQEIFLESDGSGDLVIHISMPDVPEAMKKNAPPTPQDPQKLFNEIKQKIANELPATITLKDAKEVQRNGAIAFYMVVHFNRLEDVSSMLGKVSRESLSGAESKDGSLWNIQRQKAGDLTMITQSFYADMGMPPLKNLQSDEKPSSIPETDGETKDKISPESAPKAVSPADFSMNGLMSEETMNMVVSSLFKLRFILHTPKKIGETNADFVLNGNTAIWNATFGAFAKEKKPIEMKVSY